MLSKRDIFDEHAAFKSVLRYLRVIFRDQEPRRWIKTFAVKNLATLSVYYGRQNENVSPLLLKCKTCALQGWEGRMNIAY
jgi:hypothetical protein